MIMTVILTFRSEIMEKTQIYGCDRQQTVSDKNILQFKVMNKL